MKLVSRVVAVLSVLALATPALACACNEHESTKSAQATTPSKKVAKADKKSASHQKRGAEAKPATASN